MTDQTPRTEAGLAYLAIPAHEDDSPRHVDDYEASWFIRGYETAAHAPAQARTEALDVVREAEALIAAYDADPTNKAMNRMWPAIHNLRVALAILAGETV